MPESPAAVCCSTIPHSRNQRFYGRASELKEIAQSFEEQFAFSKIRTVAIWGTGGIGKSQIALEYGHRSWDSGTSVILWIACETKTEIAKSFNDAAANLQLSGFAETNTPDKNRHLVLQWLQTTNTPWLMILDNVEDESIVKNCPDVGNGSVLMTCRSELLAESLATSPIEIPAFSTSESTALILQILNKPNPSPEEIAATNNLSGQLGGLALAIDIIAKNIKASRRFKSVEDFLPYYEQNRRTLNKRARRGIRDTTYSKDLETVWQTAFESLDSDSNTTANPDGAKLLQLLSVLAPDAIPQWVLQQKVDSCPNEWEFLADDIRFEDAKLELVDLSLIKINADTGLVSIHRLIQKAYRDQMSRNSLEAAFAMTFKLLRSGFPRREGETHLLKRWAVCELLHPHVQALRRLQVWMKDNGFTKQGPDYRLLISNDAWYTLEIEQYKTAEKLYLSLLSDIDETSVEYAHINRCLMGIYERTGRSNRAIECAKIELGILLEHGISDGNGLANAYSDMGYSLCSAFRAAEALPYLDRAIEIAKLHPEPQRYSEFNIDRFLRNHGRANQQLGRYKDALADFEEAEAYQVKIHGENSHYDGETKHERAKIAAWECKLQVASDLNAEAIRLVSEGKPNHSSVSAALYRRGWLFVLMKKYDDALLQFGQALVICRLNEAQRGNAGESARVLWQMAQIYEHKGQIEDARKFRETAEEIKRALHETTDYAQPDDPDASWDSLVGLLYR